MHFPHPRCPCCNRLGRGITKNPPLLFPRLQALAFTMQPSHHPQSPPQSQSQPVLLPPPRNAASSSLCLAEDTPWPPLPSWPPGSSLMCYSANTPAGGHDSPLSSYHTFELFLLFLLLDPLLGSFHSVSPPHAPVFCSSQPLAFPTLPIPVAVQDSCRNAGIGD